MRSHVAALAVAAAILCAGGRSQAQTFEVTERSGDTALALDTTHLVSFTVGLTGGETLQNVVPTLTPPVCGQVSVGAETVNVFNTTYAGYRSGGSWIATPVPTWDSDTTQELAFAIHLHDNPPTQSVCADLCEAEIPFGLELTASSMAMPMAAASNSLLTMSRPSVEGYELTSLAAELSGPIGVLDIFTLFDWFLHTHTLTDDPSDPDVRALMMFDWNANTQNLTGVFFTMYFPITTGCGVMMGDAFLHEEVEQLDEPLYDSTGTLPSGAEGLVTQAPVGGAGTQYDPLGTGMNFFDISHLPACGGPMVEDIDYEAGTNYYASFHQSGITVIVIRNVALYLARPRQCTASQVAFGPPTDELRFVSVSVAEGPVVNAQLGVPDSWLAGADLSADYSVEWYLRSHDVLTPVEDVGSDGLSLSLEAFTSAADVGQRFLEARIHHPSTASVLSLVSEPFQIPGEGPPGSDPPADADGSDADGSDTGCGCRSAGHPARMPLWLAGLLVLARARRQVGSSN